MIESPGQLISPLSSILIYWWWKFIKTSNKYIIVKWEGIVWFWEGEEVQGWRLFLIGKHSALQNHKAVTHYQVVNTDTINIDWIPYLAVLALIFLCRYDHTESTPNILTGTTYPCVQIYPSICRDFVGKFGRSVCNFHFYGHSQVGFSDNKVNEWNS